MMKVFAPIKKKQKIALLKFTQERAEVWEALEYLVNRYDDNFDDAFKREKIESAFKNCIEKLEAISISHEIFDAATLENFREQIKADIAVCQNKLGMDAEYVKILKATGVDSVMTLVKDRLIHTVRFSQRINQDLSFRAGTTRGFYHDVCEQAIKEINEHYADPYNPILPEHQGYYSGEDLSYEFPIKGSNDDTLRKTLMGICNIEKVDVEKNKCLLETAHVHWVSNRSYFDILLRGIAWVFNLASTFIGFFIDIGLGFFSGMLGEDFPSLGIQMRFETENSLHHNTVYHKLRQKINLPASSRGMMIGKLVWQGISSLSELLLDSGNGILNYINEKTHFFHQINLTPAKNFVDFDSGLDKELFQLTNQMKVQKEKLEQLRFVSPSEQKEGDQSKLALPPYHLNSGQWNDPASVIFKGAKLFIESVITQPLMLQPGSNLAFYLVFSLNLYFLMVPDLASVSHANPVLHTYLNYINSKLTSSKNAAAVMGIAAAPAHVVYEGINFAVEGRGWIKQFLEQFEKDPSLLLPWVKEFSNQDPALVEKFFSHVYQDPLLSPLQSQMLTPNLSPARLILSEVANSSAEYAKRYMLGRIGREDSSIDLPKELAKELKQSVAYLFLEKIERHRELLPFLNPKTKEELIHYAKEEFFAKRPEIIIALKAKLYPEEPYSPLVTFLLTIFHYLVSSVWCIFGPFYNLWLNRSCIEPWMDWGNQTLTIAAHAANLVGWVVHNVLSWVAIVGRFLGDVFVNCILGRLEAKLSSLTSTLGISEFSYSVSAESHSTYEYLRQYFSKPIDSLRKSNKTLMPALSQIVLQDKVLSISKHPLFSPASVIPKRRLFPEKTLGQPPKLGYHIPPLGSTRGQ